jgi:hypothetical protein
MSVCGCKGTRERRERRERDRVSELIIQSIKARFFFLKKKAINIHIANEPFTQELNCRNLFGCSTYALNNAHTNYEM